MTNPNRTPRLFCRAVIVVLALASPTLAQEKPMASTAIEQMTGHRGGAVEKQPRFTLPDGVRLDDGLSEDEAVAIALWNNATLHADLATLGLARADLVDAGLLRNPLLSLVFPIGPYRQFEGMINFPLEIFWQRRKRIDAARLELRRVAESLEQNALNLVRDVRVAYSDWLLAEERARLTGQAVEVRDQIARLTDVRLRVGDVGEIEATAARLDQNLAREQAVRSRREVTIARDRLGLLLGMTEQSVALTGLKAESPSPKNVIPASLPSAGKENSPTLDEALDVAYASRPDLRAASLAIEVAAQRAKWEHTRIATLAGLLNIKRGAGVPLAPRPGVLVEAPIFNRNQGGIARADAEVERAAWNYLAVRQRITGEVREAFQQYQQAREALALWQSQIMPVAEENVRLSRRSFDRGDQSYLFVMDAARRLVEIRQREAELNGDLRRAMAQIDRATGQKIGRDQDAKH